MKIVGLKDICPPAQFYFILSIVSLVIMGYQNLGNSTLYCIGDYNCDVPNTGMVFVIKLLYVVFWTWLLNVICRGFLVRVANCVIAYIIVIYNGFNDVCIKIIL